MEQHTLLSADTSLLVLIDLQEKLLPVIQGVEAVTATCEFLLDAAALLDIPVMATEQYPQGLGGTISSLRTKLRPQNISEKLTFSGADQICGHIQQCPSVSTVLLTGIETHICVQQTALQLLERGLRVQLVLDGVSGRREQDHLAAISRMQAAGVVVGTAESAVFEWCGSSEHPQFRAISRLVRDRAAA